MNTMTLFCSLMIASSLFACPDPDETPNAQPYAHIFKKPYRQPVGLGVSGLLGLYAGRNFVRCLHGKPVGAVTSALIAVTSAHFFQTVEANSPQPHVITNARFSTLAQSFRTHKQAEENAFDALNGIKLRAVNLLKWSTSVLVTQFDNCFGDENANSKK